MYRNAYYRCGSRADRRRNEALEGIEVGLMFVLEGNQMLAEQKIRSHE